jgi:hypothetical protein
VTPLDAARTVEMKQALSGAGAADEPTRD